MLLGFSEETKGYRLYDPIANKVIINRDVIFEEEKDWDWSVDYQDQILTDLEWEDEHEVNENESVNDAAKGINDEGNETGEAANFDAKVANEAAEESTVAIESVETGGRRRNAPTWMRDYVDGESLIEEEDEVYVTLTANEETDGENFPEMKISEKK